MIILKRLLPYLSFPLNNQLNGRLIRYFLNHVFDDLTKTVGVHKRHSDGRANNKCHFRFLPVDYPVRLSSGPCAGNNRELKQRRGRWQREQQKEQSVLINKTTTLHVHHVFCTFLCRHCTTTTWNFLISRSMEDVNRGQRFPFSFVNLDTVF